MLSYVLASCACNKDIHKCAKFGIPQIDGEWRYDARSRSLVWSIDLIDDTNRSGSMEFVVPAADPESFYPVEVSFTATQTLCDIDVEQVSWGDEI